MLTRPVDGNSDIFPAVSLVAPVGTLKIVGASSVFGGPPKLVPRPEIRNLLAETSLELPSIPLEISFGRFPSIPIFGSGCESDES